MANLGDFSYRMRFRAQNLEANVDRLVRKVAIAADQAVVSGTPVDTGRARSNWLVEIGSTPAGTRAPYVPGEAGSTGAANTQAALDHAQDTVRGYRGSEHSPEIHITNNLPYIEELNQGSSKQAPENFVEMAIHEAVKAVANTRVVDD